MSQQFAIDLDDLDPVRPRWARALPDGSPARNSHSPLIVFIANKLNYADERFVSDLAHGMPITGPAPTTPGLSGRKRQAQMSYRVLRRGMPKRNKAAIGRVTESQGAEPPLKWWGAVISIVGKLREVRSGGFARKIRVAHNIPRIRCRRWLGNGSDRFGRRFGKNHPPNAKIRDLRTTRQPFQ